MKTILAAFIAGVASMGIGAATGRGAQHEAPRPPVIFVTGRKKHEVSWAQKRFKKKGCFSQTQEAPKADMVLDLEPVDAPPPPDYRSAPTGVVVCRDSKSGMEVNCSDVNGETLRTTCKVARSGEVTCWSAFYDPSGVENVLGAVATEVGAAAQTHAYLTSADGKKLLWDWDESHHFKLWPGQLKKYLGCK